MVFTTFIIIFHSDWLFDRTFTCWKTVEDPSSYCLTVKLNVQLNVHASKFCMKLDRLILKKIIKIVATRCQILRLKCTKFDFGWGSLQRSPRPPSWISGATSKGREGKERGREGEGREKRGWEV